MIVLDYVRQRVKEPKNKEEEQEGSRSRLEG